MDCEKFDQIIIDALYDELDELTLAAAKRHTDGCQRCQTAWSGLRATRKVGILPLVPAPAGLEDRILAAARAAQTNVAWPKRVGRAVSRAGAYAMRPQTAMATLFLVVTGFALLFIRPKPDRSGAPSQVSVTERGVPELPFEEPRAKDEAAPLAVRRQWGAGPRRDDDRAAASSAPSGGALAMNEAPMEGRAKGALGKSETFAEAPPGTRARAPAEAFPNEPMAGLDKKSGSSGLGQAAAPVAAAPAPMAIATAADQSGFAAAMDLYKQGRFAEAERAFNRVVLAGDKNAPAAALHAAKSAEGARGCSDAAPKYDNVAQQYPSVRPEAQWEAANCYRAVGQYDKARSMYLALRSVAGYRDKAEQEIANLQLLRQAAPSKNAMPKAAAKPAAPSAPATNQ